MQHRKIFGNYLGTLLLFVSPVAQAHTPPKELPIRASRSPGPKVLPTDSGSQRFLQVRAVNREERTQIANLGFSIEAVRTDSVWGFANREIEKDLRRAGFQVLGSWDEVVGRGGHQGIYDFPTADSRFHNYLETKAMLEDLAKKHSDIAKLHVIGQSLEGRDIFALQINSDGRSLMEGQSTRPGAIFMGNHHAREHLSNEVPLMTAEYLLEHRDDPRISRLIDSRDLWFLPMVNPDGVEYDIEGTSYRSWRKNRRQNANGTFGVDLNRNYSYMWGTGGSSTNPSSDTYMGPTPFSEPETQAVRDFVANHLNATVLVSFHTFSELILYPWGHKYAPIEKERDLQVYRKMATTMSEWNGYTPQPSSDLYIASGDTTDWSYGTYGIFSFTFELSPKSMWQGGFYPGAGMIDRVFQDNLRPCLYLMELANDPYQVLNSGTPQWLQAPLATPISEDALKLSGSSRR